jgi:hypothetical protein
MTKDGTLTVKKGVFEGLDVNTESNRGVGYFSTLVGSSASFSSLVVGTSSASGYDCDIGVDTWIDNLTAGYINCNSSIICSRIYSTDAGEWWSDARLKDNIADIPQDVAYSIMRELRPVSFTMNKTGNPGMGFIAQEVKDLCEKYNIDLPLYGELDGRYTIPYTNFIPIIVKVLQKLLEERSLNV